MNNRDGSLNTTASASAIDFWRQPISAGIMVGVIALILLNIFDAFSTLYAISLLNVEEANPLMRILLDQGPFSFFVVKYLLAGICAVGIASCCRETRMGRWVLFGVALPLYFAVFIYQLTFLIN